MVPLAPAPVQPAETLVLLKTLAEPVVETTVPLALGEEDKLRELLVIAVTPEARRQAARDLVGKAITRLSQTRGETWIHKARLRPFIQRMDPTFNESNFGFRSFTEMIASMSDLVDTRKGEFDHELRLRRDKPATGQ